MVLRVQQQLGGSCLLAPPAALHVRHSRNHAAGQPHEAVHLRCKEPMQGHTVASSCAHTAETPPGSHTGLCVADLGGEGAWLGQLTSVQLTEPPKHLRRRVSQDFQHIALVLLGAKEKKKENARRCGFRKRAGRDGQRPGPSHYHHLFYWVHHHC